MNRDEAKTILLLYRPGTADAEDPARHLYASEGWQVIGPGLRDEQVIMGRRPT